MEVIKATTGNSTFENIGMITPEFETPTVVIVTETIEGQPAQWEVFENTGFEVYRDGAGTVQKARINGNEYPAFLSETEGLPPSLIITDSSMKDRLDGQRYVGTNDAIQEAYMASLAMASLKESGTSSPTTEQISAEVIRLQEILKSEGKLE